jgi:hypothetical protein
VQEEGGEQEIQQITIVVRNVVDAATTRDSRSSIQNSLLLSSLLLLS